MESVDSHVQNVFHFCNDKRAAICNEKGETYLSEQFHFETGATDLLVLFDYGTGKTDHFELFDNKTGETDLLKCLDY